MKLLFDFFPIILFFISYYQAHFFIENTFIGQLINPAKPEFITATIIATTVAIIASFIQVAYNWLSQRKLEKSHLFSLVLISVLGGITIMLGNPAFIQWKPTVLNWVFGGVFFISQFLGKKPLIQRAMDQQIELPAAIWKRLNLAWVIFFFISGAANLYVAFFYRTNLAANVRMDTWVDFKLFGLMGLTIAFVILQALYLARYIPQDDEETGKGKDEHNT